MQPGRCRAIGATTGRPCRVDTRSEPCPHHGPGNDKNRCGAPTAGNTLCRWNLVVNGPCRNHPDTYERILEEKRAQEAELRRCQEAKEAERTRRVEERMRAAEQLPCSYCAAEPGSACIIPGTGMAAAKTHSPRFKLLDHTQAAAIPCQSCGASAGDLCRTSAGKQAVEAHMPRRWAD
ncbi:zinc finger domain-containing protein [Streptomyces sp. NPDC002403]